MDGEGLELDVEHVNRTHRVRDVAAWHALPFDQSLGPKKHTKLSAMDPGVSGGGELWLLRVPADFDLTTLDNASFQWDAADGNADSSLSVALDPSKAASIATNDTADKSTLFLSARAPEAAAAFKCAFPTKAINVDTGTEVSFLRFGPMFDRAFTLHAAPGAAPVIDEIDDEFLNIRHRVPPLSHKQLKHKFVPIGAKESAAVAKEKSARKEKHREKKASDAPDSKKSSHKDKDKDKEEKSSISKTSTSKHQHKK
jgi:hypothetical protein